MVTLLSYCAVTKLCLNNANIILVKSIFETNFTKEKNDNFIKGSSSVTTAYIHEEMCISCYALPVIMIIMVTVTISD